ncbi:DNA-directed RNA polymerase III subunit RPC4 [Melanotaenia boesemani]|uniref:DNA-directed RNA polymerase III subunit RPC4 n=1 Tax=Melanotaenia boesemani TaxID=1250792 RepID=UPI001C05D01A|nr:DNA-directed RNA polymerase III subunit RPC4 [Melanotaenia boesemani]
MADPTDPAGASGSSDPSFNPGKGPFGRVRTLSSSQPGRLTSLRTRDLTLGGALKKTKKTFEPNVHAVRKNKDEVKEEVYVAPKKEKRKRDERRRQSRDRRRERPLIIQSHSIFEQGPADSERRPGWHGAAGLHDSTSSAVCRLLKTEGKESTEHEDHLLSKLQRDDFIDDPGLRNDPRLKPIQLPLCHSSDVSVTRTPSTTGPKSSALFRAEARLSHHAELQKPDQPSLVKLLQDLSLSGGEELFFMQLPDCMPGRAAGLQAEASPGSGTPAKKEGKSEGRTSAQSREAVQKENCVVLSQFPEGFLGKLQIRKSGKMELKLGDIVMDVSEGAAFSFLQQLVSVRLSDGQTGNMMVLGNVRHKLVLSPDFQVLLGQAAAQEP